MDYSNVVGGGNRPKGEAPRRRPGKQLRGSRTLDVDLSKRESEKVTSLNLTFHPKEEPRPSTQ